jgi:sarcosine dehydrogenase
LNDQLIKCDGVESTGWIQNGGLFLAHSAQRLSEYRRLYAFSKYYDIESHMLDKSGLFDLLGGLIEGEESNLLGGLYSPGDGNVDPSLYCNALKKAAGIECNVIENAEVIDINVQSIDSLIQDKKIRGQSLILQIYNS